MAGVKTVQWRAGILGCELRSVAGEHEVLAGAEDGAVCEDEADAAGESQAGEIEGRNTDVFYFEEFEFVAVHAAEFGRVIHDFAQLKPGEVLRGIELGLDDCAPDSAA